VNHEAISFRDLKDIRKSELLILIIVLKKIKRSDVKMKSQRSVLFILLVTMLFFISCSKGSDSYYPLKEGITWTYQISMSRLGSAESQKIVVTNFASRDLKGKKVTPQKLDVNGQTSFSFYAEDESGIFEYASQGPGAPEPEIKVTPTYTLKNPIQVGTTWEDKTKTAFENEKIPYTLKSMIESKDEIVTVPAGTFKGCIKVKGTGSAEKNTGLFGIAKIKVEHYDWYAPGIGMIKSIVKESSNNIAAGYGGEATLQLESFKK
jgi:hypothetical protein